ncbi:hypothetical protein B0A48_10196 [Cryoendolithus antarcticus]|uniref:Uncharacterized protein n=1 Tax=Cryoendolithus antarcticus TaxID=1507870 RepID=A0A1V8SXA7_9PEZI|nr:hypothetical protein B0A48_10196 [Cryoendolithus antarcticus]
MKPTNPTSLKVRDPPYHESWKYRVLVATLERLWPAAPEQHEQQTAAPPAGQQQQHTAPRHLQHKARHTAAFLSDLGPAPTLRPGPAWLNATPGAGAGAGVLT